MNNSLYLIPCTIGEEMPLEVIPPMSVTHALQCRSFVVENLRTARRYLRSIGFSADFNATPFFEVGKHSNISGLSDFMVEQIKVGPIGVLSESGCPGIADPGAETVRIAHQKNIEVVPLVGPTSILLTLMASGFNGQQFTFHGYLPMDKNERGQKIKQLEQQAQSRKHTQLFIEAPFRNNALLAQILDICGVNTMLCIASEINQPNQMIKSKTIGSWRSQVPDLHKKMVVYALF